MKEYCYFKSIQIPLYGGKLVVIISNNGDKIKKLIPTFDNINIYAHTYSHPYKEKWGYFVIFNFNNKYDKITYGTIVHEAIHACSFLFDHRGVRADFKNDEPVAYFVEWVVDEIYKFIKAKNFKL